MAVTSVVACHAACLDREAPCFRRCFRRLQTLEWPHAAPLDVVQEPGETIFVPCGWWHCVMNLDTTVAVTQNYVASSNFGAAWRWTRKGRPKTSQRWLEALRRRVGLGGWRVGGEWWALCRWRVTGRQAYRTPHHPCSAPQGAP